MQSAFGTVIWVVCGLAVVIGLLTLIRSGKTWDDYGKRGLLMEHESDHSPHGETPASTDERDEEVRQMLEARNARRARRGEAPVDLEQELARLSTPKIDEALRAEIRELVEARNFRRVRQGKEPLDVAAEVEREIAGLDQT